jgi:hypothetical protein
MQTKNARPCKISLASLKRLELDDIATIEKAVRKVGSAGEIRLIVENGRIRYIRILKINAA